MQLEYGMVRGLGVEISGEVFGEGGGGGSVGLRGSTSPTYGGRAQDGAKGSGGRVERWKGEGSQQRVFACPTVCTGCIP
jgi:hypothetical protein